LCTSVRGCATSSRRFTGTAACSVIPHEGAIEVLCAFSLGYELVLVIKSRESPIGRDMNLHRVIVSRKRHERLEFIDCTKPVLQKSLSKGTAFPIQNFHDRISEVVEGEATVASAS
jgi:hypothetical protein